MTKTIFTKSYNFARMGGTIFKLPVCSNSAYYFSGQDNLLGGQWAMSRLNLLGEQNNLQGGQMPAQLTCYLPP